jgi:16S rRNA (cytosine1402-N4)-methyltransferase
MSEEIKDEKNIAVDSADEKTANTTKNGDMQNVGAEMGVKTGAETGSESVHHRRPHYSGKYPKRFNEKYKELNADKYQDTVAKVRSKGSTPAGTHVPIMVQEIMNFLQIQPGQQGLDATLGYGGHSKEMLARLKGEGHLYATDVDPLESAKTVERLKNMGFGENIFTLKLMNFAKIDQLAAEVGPFNFILADLGVSSMQIDNPERGFSYKVEGPLDLRMNPLKGIPAWKRLMHLSEDEIVGMLEENSDEPYAAEIAKTITRDLHQGVQIRTTTALHEEIVKALSKIKVPDKKEVVKKSSARVFQALRIDINSEFEVLYTFLNKLPYVLAPGGRVAILTFHSGEDRLVKKSFKEFFKEGLYAEIADNVTRPSAEECFRNGRAKPAKLRWAIKS